VDARGTRIRKARVPIGSGSTVPEPASSRRVLMSCLWRGLILDRGRCMWAMAHCRHFAGERPSFEPGECVARGSVVSSIMLRERWTTLSVRVCAGAAAEFSVVPVLAVGRWGKVRFLARFDYALGFNHPPCAGFDLSRSAVIALTTRSLF